MDSSQPPLQQPPEIFIPLMLTAVAVMFTAFIIAIYHYVCSRYHRRHGSTTDDDQRALQQRPIERHPMARTTGVEDKLLECIPILPYSSKQEQVFRVDQSDCAVCLGEFEEGVVVRLLPSCGHAFHVQCIDEWFFCHSSCPICRSPVVSPVSLPVATVPVGIDDEPSNDGDHGGGGHNDTVVHIGSIGRSTRSVASFRLPNEKNTSLLPVVLRRSTSVDGSYVAIRVHGGQQGDSSSSSSSSASASSSSSTSSSLYPSSMAPILVDNSYRFRSFKCLDQASSAIETR